MSKIILILSEPRSGSSLLSNIIDGYTEIRNLTEFFPHEIHDFKFGKSFDYLDSRLTPIETHNIFSPLGIDADSYSAENICLRRNRIVEILTQIHKVIPNDVCIKIQNYQLDGLDISKIISLPFVEVLLLERTDKIRWHVSGLQAESINNFSQVDTSNLKVTVDINRYRDSKRRSHLFYALVKYILFVSNKKYLHIIYERDLENFSIINVQDMISTWLSSISISSEYSGTIIPFIKQNKGLLCDVIENYDTIQKYIEEDIK